MAISLTMYVAGLLVQPKWRGRGIGGALLEVRHALDPAVRIDLLAATSALSFYAGRGFHLFPGCRKSHR